MSVFTTDHEFRQHLPGLATNGQVARDRAAQARGTARRVDDAPATWCSGSATPFCCEVDLDQAERDNDAALVYWGERAQTCEHGDGMYDAFSQMASDIDAERIWRAGR